MSEKKKILSTKNSWTNRGKKTEKQKKESLESNPRKAFSLEQIDGVEYQLKEILIKDDIVVGEKVIYRDLLELVLEKADSLFAKEAIIGTQ